MFGICEAQNIVNEFNVVVVMLKLEVPRPSFCFPPDKV